MTRRRDSVTERRPLQSACQFIKQGFAALKMLGASLAIVILKAPETRTQFLAWRVSTSDHSTHELRVGTGENDTR